MCSIEIANQANHSKEYAVTTHRNVWYFYRYHPMLSNGTRGLALPAYFELLPWGTFPVFTQRASCHFITRRFTYFYRTRTSGGFPRIFPDSHVTSICVYRTSALGKLSPTISRPVSLPHDRSLGPSPINITRSRLAPSPLHPTQRPFPLFPRNALPPHP